MKKLFCIIILFLTSTLAYAQRPDQIELPCPAGSSPTWIGQSYDQATGKYRQWQCVDNNGRVNTHLIDGGGQVFNVKAYGAKGDGVTDDSPAFQAAWNAAKAVKGIVFIPPPQAGACYLLNTAINMTSNPNVNVDVTVEGTTGDYGYKTAPASICGNTGGNVFDVTGSNNIRFWNVSVTSQKGVTNPSLVGIFAARLSNGTGAQSIFVRDCVFSMVLHTSGTVYSFGAYLYASENDNFDNDAFQADYPLVMTEANDFSLTSTFQTVATGAQSNTDDHFTDMELQSAGLGPTAYFNGAHNVTLTGHSWNYSQGASYSASLYQYALYFTGSIQGAFVNWRQEGYPGFALINLSFENSVMMGSDAPGATPALHAVEFTDASAIITSDTFRITDEYGSSTTNYFYDATVGSTQGVAILDDVDFACGGQSNCIDIPIGLYQPGGWSLYARHIKYSSSPTNMSPSVIVGGGVLSGSFSIPASAVAANTCSSLGAITDSAITPTSFIAISNTIWYNLIVGIAPGAGSFTPSLCNPTSGSITPGAGIDYWKIVY